MKWILQTIFDAVAEIYQDDEFPVEIYLEEYKITFSLNGYRYSLELTRIGENKS